MMLATLMPFIVIQCIVFANGRCVACHRWYCCCCFCILLQQRLLHLKLLICCGG